MASNRSSAFILVGPTASGKSSVAQYLAEQRGAAVVSADSMNIYRGMDLGTAKPSLAERGAVTYFGVDFVAPTDSFSVGDWLRAIAPAFEPGAPSPIVAGGTGLYVKCLLAGLDPQPPPDPLLRARAESMSLSELQAAARAAAPQAYDSLADPENPRRLIRFLERGGAPSRWDQPLPQIIGLSVERNRLCERIARRVDQMYADGLIDEARGLIDQTLSTTAQHAIGYAEAFAVLRGEISEAAAKQKTIVRTRQLAKRQMSWFRNQLCVKWVDTASFSTVESLAAAVASAGREVPIAR